MRGETGRTSHTRNEEKTFGRYVIFLNDVIYRIQGIVQYLADPTARAKNGWEPVPAHTGLFQVGQHRMFHSQIPLTAEDAEIAKKDSNQKTKTDLILQR
jgi:hypothetical protein